MRVVQDVLSLIAFLVVVLFAFSFCSMLAATGQFGGSALNGYVQAGHYYLNNHGTYTEVSKSVWDQVRMDELRVVVGIPVAALSFLYLLVSFLFPLFMGLRQGPSVIERMQSLRTSGEVLASVRSGGGVAGLKVGLPLLRVDVYPGGISIRPLLQQPVAILKAEIRRVEWADRGWTVEIDHRSPDIASPVALSGAEWQRLALVLDQFARTGQTS